MPLTPGQRLGPYEILATIGAGGMGKVYRARDPRLNRDVAIKVLSERFGDRFEREAHAIAALNHPHICQIYDIGPNYLVMELVDGTPLQGPLSVEKALPLASQIASALEEAHRKGITHRDLKPDNILVTKSGVKLLDFGLAKREQAAAASDATQTHTQIGTVLGTAAYMSPEQASGQPADARSDIFSFGVVLYEMLSGQRAFQGATQGTTIAAVLRDQPSPLQAPPDLAQVVMRCLRKSPSDRFQTMADVKAALEAVRVSPAAEAQPSIAVLPFADMSAGKDHEWFSDGLAEEIINALTHVPGLKVIARTSAFAFKGQHTDIRRIAEALGVANILEGSVRQAGSRVRVTAQLITAADGSPLWSERYDREMADVFAIQDEIAQAIAGALQVKLSSRAADRRHYQPELPAYEAYLRGRHQMFRLTPESWQRAKECFEQAIALDPRYAQPHASLGLGYLLTETAGIESMRAAAPRIRAAAQKALELDPSEPGPRFLLGSIAAAHDYDWQEAARQFQAALAPRAVSADTRWAYASLYLQPLGRFREGAEEMQLAVEQDPLNVSWRAIRLSHLTHAGRYDQALAEAPKALEIDENHWVTHFVVSEAYVAKGTWTEALAAAERAYRGAPWHALNRGTLAGLLFRLGEKDRAAELIRQMGDTSASAWGRVHYHLLCSEIDAAADWYERSIEQRELFALIFAQAPITRALRESPRWPRLARLMNLPETVG